MDKVRFVLDIVMGLSAFLSLIWLKATERKLGKKDKVIATKKSLGDRILYIMGIYLILSKTIDFITSLFKNNLDIYFSVRCLSGILVAIMVMQLSNAKIKIMDNGIIYKFYIINKENLLVVNLLEEGIEVKYKAADSYEALNLITEKENDKEIVPYLKSHFNI